MHIPRFRYQIEIAPYLNFNEKDGKKKFYLTTIKSIILDIIIIIYKEAG